MKRFLAGVGLTCLALPLISLAGVPNLSRDLSYEPKPNQYCLIGATASDGDRLINAYGATTKEAHRAYRIALLVEDRLETAEYRKSGQVLELKLGTLALILDVKQEVIGTGLERWALIKPTHGDAKGKILWIDQSSILRRAKAGEPAFSQRARDLLSHAQSWEKAGNRAVTVSTYKLLCFEFPQTAESKVAQQRLMALGESTDANSPGSIAGRSRTDEQNSVPTLPPQPRRKKRRSASQAAARAATAEMMGQMMGQILAPSGGGGGGYGGFGGSRLCGAPTLTGAPCRRPVAGGGYCYQHR